MKTFATAAAVSLIAAAPALAGGFAEPVAVPVVTPAPVVVTPTVSADWSGAYVGGQLGFGRANIANDDAGFDEDYSGAIGGLHAGYNFDFGRVVAGVEAAYDWSNIELGEEGVTATGDLESVARVGARLGYDAGRALPFVTAGWTQANVGGEGIDESYNGYFVGGGVDYAVTERVTVGAQVLYHDFEVDEFAGADVEGFDSSLTTFGIRASFRF